MIIYKITNKINGMCYIGQTRSSLQKRWVSHCSAKRHTYLIHAINKYGKENFSIEEIGRYSNDNDLDNAEIYFIEFHNSLSPNGYNLENGGNCSKKIHPDSKDKMSLMQSWRFLKNPGTFTGRKHSEAAKEKNRVAHLGKSPANKGKPGPTGKDHPFYGRKHTEKAKHSMSLKRKGISPWCTGTKGVVKAWNKGLRGAQTMSEETRKKMSVSRKKYLENKKNRVSSMNNE